MHPIMSVFLVICVLSLSAATISQKMAERKSAKIMTKIPRPKDEPSFLDDSYRW